MVAVPWGTEVVAAEVELAACVRRVFGAKTRRRASQVGQLRWAQPRVAIVGSRQADPQACDFAFQLAQACARAGVTVVSGGAFGIDVAAHRGALAADGITWVVLGSGLAQPYPLRHVPVFDAARRRGALLSLFPEAMTPRASTFLQRNQLIAGLADAVVVVQARPRSGALSTAHAAQTQGTPLWVCPASPWDPRGVGNRALLAEGAQPLDTAATLLRALGIEPAEAAGGDRVRAERAERVRCAEPQDAELSPDALRVWASLSPAVRDLSAVCAYTGLAPGQVAVALAELELARRLRALPGGTYVALGVTA